MKQPTQKEIDSAINKMVEMGYLIRTTKNGEPATQITPKGLQYLRDHDGVSIN